MKRIVGISLLTLLLCMACNTASELVFDDGNASGTSIAELKTCYRGKTIVISEELKIKGIVTANDYLGEFPKTLVIQDASGGIELSVDHTTLADLYPVGAAVTVYCTGLALGEYGGKIRLGAKPTGTYDVDRIAKTDVDRYIRCTELNAQTRQPRTRSFSDITLADADTYVRFENVCFAEVGDFWCDRDSITGKPVTSQRTLIDSNGTTFPVRVSSQSHYATGPIPEGTGSVNGIIDYFNGEFSLRIICLEIFFTASAMHPTAYPSAAEYSAPSPTR